MSSFSNVIAAALFALAAAAPAQAMTDSERERLAEYERFAGEPVKDMPFWRLQSYEALGNEAVVVWTGVNKAWLIRVLPPCTDLPWAKTVGLSSTTSSPAAIAATSPRYSPSTTRRCVRPARRSAKARSNARLVWCFVAAFERRRWFC